MKIRSLLIFPFLIPRSSFLIPLLISLFLIPHSSFLIPPCQAQSSFTRSQLASYANSLSGLKKEELKTAVYALSQPQSVLNYGSGTAATWWGFWYTDRVSTITNECFNRYSDKQFYFSSHDSKAIDGMNIEHSFPKSWWGGSTYVDAYKDLFNLYPSDSEANSSKSNYPMATVTDILASNGDNYDKVGTATINGETIYVWEPGDLFKGEFARGYFYMVTTYQDYTWQGTQGLQELENNTWPTLQQWAYTLYLQWVQTDPVDYIEIARNEAVYAIQGNRNLFIDFPFLAEYIWGDSIDVPFDPYTSVSTANDDDRYLSGVTISTPSFSPDGGTYYGELRVAIRTTTPGTRIFYTLDASTPTTDATLYDDTITIDQTLTLKAIATDDDGNLSDVASADYIITTAEGTTDGDTTYFFVETFDQCAGTGGNDGLWSGNIASSTFTPDNDGWSAPKAYGGSQCARFGTSSVVGTATTPTIAVDDTLTLTFIAAAWGSDGTGLTLSVDGNATLSQTNFTLTASQWTTYSLTLIGSGYITLTFTPTKRWFLDDMRLFSVETATEEETNAVSAIHENATSNDAWYDLFGRRVQQPAHGIYIHRGQKVMIP